MKNNFPLLKIKLSVRLKSVCTHFFSRESWNLANLFFWRDWHTATNKKTPCKHLLTRSYKLNFVPRAGVEPAQVALLVFETSASTDSAIWAAMQ